MELDLGPMLFLAPPSPRQHSLVQLQLVLPWLHYTVRTAHVATVSFVMHILHCA